MWCLARLLPLMIGDRVSDDDEYWKNFLLLLDILDYVFAPVISTDCVAHLKVLICEHHQAFKELYPTCSIIPKMHYMIHYPECIEKYIYVYVLFLANSYFHIMYRFGPLVRSWCMRFEGKHNYFKDLARRVRCYKNIPKTLASRHQHMMCYYFGTISDNGCPFGKNSTVGPCELLCMQGFI